MRLKWFFSGKMSSHVICESFWLKIKKLSKLAKLELFMNEQSISFLEKSFLPKKEGAKDAGGSQSSCLYLLAIYSF